MASPNCHPLPDDNSSEDEVNSYKELLTDDSDYSDYEWERHIQILWKEFDEAKAELDADKEKEEAEAQIEELVEEENKKKT